MSDLHTVKAFKKKRKKSCLSRAKKFGKSGRFGHGSHVSEDTYNYFIRVVELNRGKFDTQEEKEIFVSNTFEQTIGQEVVLATNQFTSYAIEQLIPNAKHSCLEKFMTALALDLRPICCDIFASHVIQSLLKSSSDRIQNLLGCEGEEPDVWLPKYIEWILKVGRFLLNNIEEFAWETYANPIIRTVLEVISGGIVTHNSDKKSVAKKLEVETKPKTPKLLRSLLKDYCKTISSLAQLSDLTSSSLTSGLLQSLVLAVARADIKRLVPLFNKLTEVLQPRETLDDSSTRLLESMLSVAPAPLFSQLFEAFFRGKLQTLSRESNSNFSVQRLFDNCSNKDQLQLLLDEIGSANMIEEILNAHCSGVILAMGKACHRLLFGQGTFIQNLMTALHCISPVERQMKIAPLVLSLLNYESYEQKLSRKEEGDPPLVTLHGSLLLQSLLGFNKPIKIIQSLLGMEPSELAMVLRDTKGSHVTDAFMTSSFVGEKSREKLCQHLKGHWADMACSVWGSRSLDATWKTSSVKARQIIATELAQHIARLKGDKYGRHILQDCEIELYRRQPKEWVESQTKALRQKKTSKELPSGLDEPPSKVKKV